MDRDKTILKAVPLLIGIGFLLSACAADPGYDPTAYRYDYDYPLYGSPDYDYWGGCGDWHRRWDHGHEGHGFDGHGHDYH